MKENLLVLPVSHDNYTYILESKESLLVIDPSNAAEIISMADKLQKPVEFVLNTHHHSDHCLGNKALAARYNCPIGGIGKDNNPFLTTIFNDEEVFEFGAYTVKVLYTPGHTKSSLCFLVKRDNENHFLFSGDTLFSMGCGRIFDGSFEELYDSLLKIRNLSDDIQVFAGHEYTLDNLTFAIHVGFRVKELHEKRELLLKRLAIDEIAVPFSLSDEKKYNPFLNCDKREFWNGNKDFAKKTPLEIFTKLRQDKNNY